MKTPLSIYRGQAKTGIGEDGTGPLRGGGEQYLAADEPLRTNPSLLQQLHAWMTLDFSPTDTQTMGENLEAWSYIPILDYRFVIRLCIAGQYSHQRTAYYAHGYGWQTSDFNIDTDPGYYLGQSECFVLPWRDQPVPDVPDYLTLSSEIYETAVNWNNSLPAYSILAHLHYCIITRTCLVIVAGIKEFRKNSKLHQLVSFARSALPSQLARDCSIRIFTRHPDLFLNQLGATLIVIPDDEYTRTKNAKPTALFLGLDGKPIDTSIDILSRDHKIILEKTKLYANEVIEQYRELPDTLCQFSYRCQQTSDSTYSLSDEDIRRIQINYILAHAYSLDRTKNKRLLDSLVVALENTKASHWEQLKLGHKPHSENPVEIDKLLKSEDWFRLIPEGSIFDFIVKPPELQSNSSEEQVCQALITACKLQEKNMEHMVKDWWRDELEQEERLAALRGQIPSFVTEKFYQRLMGEKTVQQLIDNNTLLPQLRYELKNNQIDKRQIEIHQLGVAAASQLELLDLLFEATQQQQLSLDWANSLLKTINEQQIYKNPIIDKLVKQFLPEIDNPLFSSFSKVLLDQISVSELKLTDTYQQLIELSLSDKLSGYPIYHLKYIDILSSSNNENLNISLSKEKEIFSTHLSAIPEDERKQTIDHLLGSQPHNVYQYLFDKHGQPYAPWLAQYSAEILNTLTVLDKLPLEVLLDYAENCADNAAIIQRVYQAIDQRIKTEPQKKKIPDLLIKRNWWYGWRKLSSSTPKFSVQVKHNLALQWLKSVVWQQPGRPDPTLEAWNLVVEDLKNSGGLDEQVLSNLINDIENPLSSDKSYQWPDIPYCEVQQRDDLLCMATNFSVFLDICFIYDSTNKIGDTTPLPAFNSLHQSLTRNIDTSKTFRQFLGCLTNPEKCISRKLTPQKAKVLFNISGKKYTPVANDLLQHSVTHHLGNEPYASEAIAIAKKYSFFNNKEFQEKLFNFLSTNPKLSERILFSIDASINSVQFEPPSQLRISTYNQYPKLSILCNPQEALQNKNKEIIDQCFEDLLNRKKYIRTIETLENIISSSEKGYVLHKFKSTGETEWHQLLILIQKHTYYLDNLDEISILINNIHQQLYPHKKIARLFSIKDGHYKRSSKHSWIDWWEKVLKCIIYQDIEGNVIVNKYYDAEVEAQLLLDFLKSHNHKKHYQYLKDILKY